MPRTVALRPSVIVLCSIAMLSSSVTARAQTADGFNPGANQIVQTIALQPDGKVVVAGGFTGLGNGTGATIRNHIGRLNSDGTVDPSFNPGTNGPVHAVAVQPDGKILIGGNFSSVGGGNGLFVTRNRIARFLADGQVDTGFNPGANNNVWAIALQPDGKILVGGEFSTIGGGGTGTTARSRLARLDDAGVPDSFNPGASKLPMGASAIIYSLAVQPDEKILVGGYFNGLGGGTGTTARNYIGRLHADGSVDAGFDPGATSPVNAIAIQADGWIVVGGDFIGLGLGIGTTLRGHIGRLDPDGIVDPTFNPGAEAQVSTLAVQVDGKILAGGYFKWMGAAGGPTRSERNYIGRLNPDGAVDGTFNPGTNNVVNAVAVQGDGAIVAAGIFLSSGGPQGNGVLTTRNRIARFTATTPAVQTLTHTGGGTLPSNMAWARSGSGPEVWRTTFAFSFDGSFYSVLAEGGRVAGGWQANNLVNLPDRTRDMWVRAQGFYGSGYQNGSGSMVETILFIPGPPKPTMTLSPTALRFRAVTSGATFRYKTGTQIVPLTQSGAGTVSWTATPSQPWLQVSPASGTGPANLSISVVAAAGLPADGTAAGSIAFTFTGAANNPGPIAVTLSLVSDGLSENAFGNVDTPTDNRTGVAGAIPFTGWLLDDVDVQRVMICRSAFGTEVAPIDPNCAGAAQIFVGFGIFIDGARPDVAAAFPSYPRNTKAGWGFMLLTNMLPSQGNGTYAFTIYGQDVDGHTVLLGSRTMSCANASATLPFGAIDTPTQGGDASGNSFVNFGWALTQNPKFIPTDGSTMTVMIDGLPVGNVDYNHNRSDIATLFPGLANSNGAVGFRILDTTTLTNGIHTVSWLVGDSASNYEGIGSRFFTVTNGVAPSTAAEIPVTSRATAGGEGRARADAVAAASYDERPVIGRRGWNPGAPWRRYAVGSGGRAVIRGEEVDRFELSLGEHSGETYTGYLQTGDDLLALPAGSRLQEDGTFTWAPGVGFVGKYDLVFVRWSEGRVVARRNVRIILAPKGSGHVGTQVVIDTPRAQADVQQPFVLAGWSADLDASAGTGIDTLHAWAFPLAGAPVFLGVPAYGGSRPDVAGVHGDRFRDSGFGLAVQGLPAGTYDLQIFAWSNVTGGFAPAAVVQLSIK